MEIDRDLEALASEPSRQRQVIAQPRQPAPLRRDDDVVEIGIATNNRLGRRFYDVG